MRQERVIAQTSEKPCKQAKSTYNLAVNNPAV